MAIGGPVNLALQGGGAHGAFTWGVLDRLLEEPDFVFEGVSGTSAGAMNAVVLCDGFRRGGAAGAKEALATFWRAVGDMGRFSPVQRTPLDVFMGNWSLDTSPSFLAFDLLTRVASPYELNPFGFNPLGDIVREQVDFDALARCDAFPLFISATNVHTGRVRVFRCHELSADVVMASACLPFLFRAVEIDGIPYWDGGYLGNPSLHPFFNHCRTPDVLLVQVNPIERTETPRTARDILNRMNEITFNASLMAELRAIDFVRRLLADGAVDPERYTDVRLHAVLGDRDLAHLSASSKVNAEWAFLTALMKLGREAAERWLAEHGPSVGRRGTLDMAGLLVNAGS